MLHMRRSVPSNTSPYCMCHNPHRSVNMQRAYESLAEGFLAPSVIEDPYPTYAVLREHAPVCEVTTYNLWLVTSYEDCVVVLKNAQIFRQWDGPEPFQQKAIKQNTSTLDSRAIARQEDLAAPHSS